MLVKSIWNIALHVGCFFTVSYENQHSEINVDCIGGGKINSFSFDELKLYSLQNYTENYAMFKFHSYVSEIDAVAMSTNSLLIINLPLNLLVTRLTVSNLRAIASSHGIFLHSTKMHHTDIQAAILAHTCSNCSTFVSNFEPVNEEKKAEQRKLSNLNAVRKYQKKNSETYKQSNLLAVQKNLAKNLEKSKKDNLLAVQRKHKKSPEQWKKDNLIAVQKYRQKHTDFPPCPPSQKLQQTIISDFCRDTSANILTESGCTVCGQLTPVSQLQKLSELFLNLNILRHSDVSLKERLTGHDPVQGLNDDPVMMNILDSICDTCQKSILKVKRPLLALANGL